MFSMDSIEALRMLTLEELRSAAEGPPSKGLSNNPMPGEDRSVEPLDEAGARPSESELAARAPVGSQRAQPAGGSCGFASRGRGTIALTTAGAGR